MSTLNIQLIVAGLAVGATLVPIAIGFSLIMSVLKFWHLAHGAVILVAGYAVIFLCVDNGFPLVVGVLAAIAAAATVGWGLNSLLYERLRARGVTSMVMLISSLTVLVIASNLAGMRYGFDNVAFRDHDLTSTVFLGDVYVTKISFVAVAVAIVSVAGLLTWLYRTDSGRIMRAVMIDPDVAELVGVDLKRVRLQAIVIGSVLAGAPASLIAFEAGLNPNSSFEYLLAAAIAGIVGGLGSVGGTALAAVAIALIETQVGGITAPRWEPMVGFSILIAFVLVRPTGLFGAVLWRSKV